MAFPNSDVVDFATMVRVVWAREHRMVIALASKGQTPEISGAAIHLRPSEPVCEGSSLPVRAGSPPKVGDRDQIFCTRCFYEGTVIDSLRSDASSVSSKMRELDGSPR